MEEFEINSQAPANATNPALTTDAGMGTVPDETQGLADIISMASTMTPIAKTETRPLVPADYTPDMNRPVISGYQSGMPLMSTGIPMFSMTVLQEAEAARKEAKRIQYETAMKDVAELDAITSVLHINDNQKDMAFTEYQTNYWTNKLPEYTKKYGINAYKMAKRDIARDAALLKSLQTTLNTTFDNARKIVAYKAGASSGAAGDKGTDTFYVGKEAFGKAKEFLEWQMSDDFQNAKPEEINRRVNEYNKYFTKAMSLDAATDAIVKGFENLSVADNQLEEMYRWGKDKGLGWADRLGTAALTNKDIEQAYEGFMKYYYEEAYGDYSEGTRPTYEEFKTYALGKSKFQIKKNIREANMQSINVNTGSGGKKEVLNLSTPQDVKFGGNYYPVRDIMMIPQASMPSTTPTNLTRAYNMATGSEVDVNGVKLDINGIANYGGRSYVSASGVQGDKQINVVFPLTNDIKQLVDNKFQYNANFVAAQNIEDYNKSVDVLKPISGVFGVVFKGGNKQAPKQTGGGKKTYTPEQEALINKNMQANPGYTREQIINALGY